MEKVFSQRAEYSSTFATDDGVHQIAERSASLPAKLYRVQYGGCQTNHDGNGLHANDHSRLPLTLPDFAQSIEDHFTWGNGTASRYITLFSDGVHARNWAFKRSRSTGQLYDLITISTFHLSQSKLFKLSNLVAGLNLEIPDGASQHIPGAYLCLHCVPSHAIEKTYVIGGSMLRLRSAYEIAMADIVGSCFRYEDYSSDVCARETSRVGRTKTEGAD